MCDSDDTYDNYDMCGGNDTKYSDDSDYTPGSDGNDIHDRDDTHW